MNGQLSNLTGPATRELGRDRSATSAADVYLLVALEFGVTVLWVLWKAVGVDLTVDTGGGAREVGVTSVVISTTLLTAAAFGLRSVLHRARGSRGLRTWTITAVAFWLVSLIGPTAATTPSAGAALLTFHLLVGAGVIVGVRALHRPDRAPGER